LCVSEKNFMSLFPFLNYFSIMFWNYTDAT
jgi:hypothetical protein